MKNLFNEIDKAMESLEVRNEATIKQRVVVPLFLEKIGYHASKSVYEKTLGRDSVDIFIDNKMIVETKAHLTNMTLYHKFRLTISLILSTTESKMKSRAGV